MRTISQDNEERGLRGDEMLNGEENRGGEGGGGVSPDLEVAPPNGGTKYGAEIFGKITKLCLPSRCITACWESASASIKANRSQALSAEVYKGNNW